MPTVLIIEWDSTLQRQIAEVVKSADLKVTCTDHQATALELIGRSPEIAFAIYSECEEKGCFPDFMESLRTASRSVPVLYLAKTYAAAKASLDQGAADCLGHPLTADQLQIALTRLARWTQAWKLAAGSGAGCEKDWEWAGQSSALEHLKRTVRQLARTQAAVLIQGETGVGKTLTAQILHRQSQQAGGPFLILEAARLDAPEIHHQLFGSPGRYEPSLIELAQGGTLLIEDIDFLPTRTQETLLRFIESRSFQCENGEKPVPSNARLLATTRADLTEKASSGSFRDDLAIALNLLTIKVPSLKERLSDIPHLAEHFFRRFAGKFDRQVVALSKDAAKVLENHDWPGNIRELESLLFQSIPRVDAGAVLDCKHLVSPLTLQIDDQKSSATIQPEVDDLATLEKMNIFRVLEKCANNRTHAARRLGCSIRTLRNKLREYRLAAAAEASAAASTVLAGVEETRQPVLTGAGAPQPKANPVPAPNPAYPQTPQQPALGEETMAA